MKKLKIWSYVRLDGKRFWYFKCQECALFNDRPNWFVYGDSLERWEFAWDDARMHLEMYH